MENKDGRNESCNILDGIKTTKYTFEEYVNKYDEINGTPEELSDKYSDVYYLSLTLTNLYGATIEDMVSRDGILTKYVCIPVNDNNISIKKGRAYINFRAIRYKSPQILGTHCILLSMPHEKREELRNRYARRLAPRMGNLIDRETKEKVVSFHHYVKTHNKILNQNFKKCLYRNTYTICEE